MPYAAKALIEYEFDTNHLNVWLTFRCPMDMLHKPPDALWIVTVDSILKPVSDSAWQDEYTLLLTVPDIATTPDRVLVEYNGPNENLRTTWEKQWQPFGPILGINLAETLFLKGMIILWSGSVATIPAGWQLCNGSNGTPDLRDRFIVGAGTTYAPGNAGGNLEHLHTQTSHQHWGALGAGELIASGAVYSRLVYTSYVAPEIQVSNHLPPYYALCYIMKL